MTLHDTRCVSTPAVSSTRPASPDSVTYGPQATGSTPRGPRTPAPRVSPDDPTRRWLLKFACHTLGLDDLWHEYRLPGRLPRSGSGSWAFAARPVVRFQVWENRKGHAGFRIYGKRRTEGDIVVFLMRLTGVRRRRAEDALIRLALTGEGLPPLARRWATLVRTQAEAGASSPGIPVSAAFDRLSRWSSDMLPAPLPGAVAATFARLR